MNDDASNSSDSLNPSDVSDHSDPVDPDVPPPPTVDPIGEGETPLEHIVDDVEPRAEAMAWAYLEMRRGRFAEDVHGDLVARGWDAADAEGLVEQARKEARYTPGAVRAAAGAAPSYRPRGGILGAIINLIVGVFSAVMSGAGTNDDADPQRRAGRIARGECAVCGLRLLDQAAPCPNCGAVPPSL